MVLGTTEDQVAAGMKILRPIIWIVKRLLRSLAITFFGVVLLPTFVFSAIEDLFAWAFDRQPTAVKCWLDDVRRLLRWRGGI